MPGTGPRETAAAVRRQRDSSVLRMQGGGLPDGCRLGLVPALEPGRQRTEGHRAGNPAVVESGNLPAQGQSQTETTLCPGPGLIHPAKAVLTEMEAMDLLSVGDLALIRDAEGRAEPILLIGGDGSSVSRQTVSVPAHRHPNRPANQPQKRTGIECRRNQCLEMIWH